MGEKISFAEEDNYKYLVYEAESTAIKNDLAIHMAENNEIPQLLEVYFAENGEMRGEYDITECSSFWDCIPKPAGRNDVFLPLQKLLFTIRALRTCFICEPDILLQKEYIYIDNKTSMIRFAAVPEILPEDNSVVRLVRDVIDTVQWKEEEKKTYLDSYMQVFKQENVGCDRLLEAIKQILEEPLEFVQPEPELPKVSEQPSPPPVILSVPPSQPSPPPVILSVPPSQPSPPPAVSSIPSPVYPVESYEDDFEGSIGETTVLGISSQPMIFPVLIRIRNNEKVIVNKMEFLIGKDPTRVDYCIFDNNAVSRVHAKIISRNGEFFVIDNHSTNHVYVNGMLIDANAEVRLTHGSRVRLGNEDFEFRFQ